MEAPPSVVGCLTPQLARKSAADSTLEGVPKVWTAPSIASAGSLAVDPASTCPCNPPPPPRWPHELQRAHLPLRRSSFEQKLKHHPNKAWVSRLLHDIDFGGYKGPCLPYQTRNLALALAHPEAVDAELDKAGRVLGPFPHCPSENLRPQGWEWYPKGMASSHVYCSRLERCRLHQSLHRRIRFPRVWCIFQLSLDQRPLATPPATTSSLHTVAGAICHFGCSTRMGAPSVRATHTIPLR